MEKSYYFFFFRSDGELRAIAEEFAFDNNKFVQTVVAAWDKLATADRSENNPFVDVLCSPQTKKVCVTHPLTT